MHTNKMKETKCSACLSSPSVVVVGLSCRSCCSQRRWSAARTVADCFFAALCYGFVWTRSIPFFCMVGTNQEQAMAHLHNSMACFSSFGVKARVQGCPLLFSSLAHQPNTQGPKFLDFRRRPPSCVRLSFTLLLPSLPPTGMPCSPTCTLLKPT